MATMRVIEETPTKMVLEMDTSQHVEGSGWGGGIGLVLGITILLILVLVWAGSSYFNTSLSWLFWVIAIGVLLAESFLVFMTVVFIFNHKNNVREATVNIDLHSQHAVRIEKLNSGKIKQYDLKLEQVSRILIHCEELGHTCNVMLDSRSNAPVEVNSDVFFDVEPMKAFGNKLGGLLKKPVVLKITEQGHIISEETIQTERRDDHRFDHLNLPRRRD